MTRFTEKHNDVAGLDIGTSSIKLAWLRRANGSVELLGTAMRSLPKRPAAAAPPSSGAGIEYFLNDAASLAEAIRSAAAEIKCTAKRAFVCLNGPNSYTKRISVVSMPEEELREAVKWQMKDQIQLDLENAVIDYQILNKTEDPKGAAQLHLLAAVAEKKFAFNCISAVMQAGLSPVSIVLSPFVLGYLNAKNPPKAVLDIGGFKAELTLFKGGVPQFSRHLPCSGSDFTRAMTGVFVSDLGRLELAYDEAERLKKEAGIPLDENGMIKPGVSNKQVLSMFRPVLEKLINEIRRSFDYCKAQLQLPAPDKICLTGGGSLLKNLNKTLAKELAIEVDYLKSADSVFFDIAHAAGLQEKSGINLIPVELKLQRLQKIQKMVLRVTTFVIAVILTLSYLSMSIQAYSLQHQINIGRSNYQTMKEVIFIKDRINKLSLLLTQAGLGQYDSATVLKAISKAMPLSVELNSLSRKEGAKLEFSGTVSSARPEVVLAELMKSMQEAKIFKNVKMISLQKEPSQPFLSRFAMQCEVSSR